jgi:predicted amidohydrolase
LERRDQIRLGVVQPMVRLPKDTPRMLDDAIQWIAEAGGDGVDLLLFPEIYPGPTTHAVRYEVVPELARAAAKHKVAVAAGTTVKVEDDDAYYVAQVVINEEGSVRGVYRRSHPRTEVYRHIFRSEFWDFEYRAGDELPVFDMGWATIGISVCSEIYVPEVARIVALRGAEICLFPTGGTLLRDPDLRDNWHSLVRARAVENVMFTAGAMNLFPAKAGQIPADPRVDAESAVPPLSIIASPERVLAAAGPGERLVSADLDLARLRLMRESQGFPNGLKVPFASVPGVMELRRPELSGSLSEDLADLELAQPERA